MTDRFSPVIRPITEEHIDKVLGVYRQCEDFLALGPQPRASLSMVLQDIETSRHEGGVYYGIFDINGEIMGVASYVTGNFEGKAEDAFISLLMLASPYRGKGTGTRVVRIIEEDIHRNPAVKTIRSAVQTNNPLAIRFWEKNGYRIVGGPEERPDGTVVYRLLKDALKNS